VTAEELRDYCHRRVVALKLSERIVFVDEVPDSDAGKVSPTALASVLAGGPPG
jgi:acyl-CoA synthetase (AMP-forming)/AMP-acid ligase II